MLIVRQTEALREATKNVIVIAVLVSTMIVIATIARTTTAESLTTIAEIVSVWDSIKNSPQLED